MGGGKGGISAATARYAPMAGKAAGRAGVLGVGAMAGGAALDYGFGEESAISRYGNSALNGAAIGGTIGSFIPVLGTAIGAAIGGAGGLLYEYLNSPSSKEPAKVETTVKVQLADGLRAQSQTTSSSGPVKNFMHTGSIWGTP